MLLVYFVLEYMMNNSKSNMIIKDGETRHPSQKATQQEILLFIQSRQRGSALHDEIIRRPPSLKAPSIVEEKC